MTISNLLRETFLALSSNKSRSGLTMLGIVIGISSVITMLAIGTGASNSIQSSIQALGTNVLEVLPGAQRTPGSPVSGGGGSANTLSMSDVQALITQIPEIENVTPVVNSRAQVVVPGNNTNTSIIGTTPSYADVHTVSMQEGSFITTGQVSSVSRVAVLGPTTRDTLFGANAEVLGQTIRIKNILFTIVGITVAKGGSGFSNPDDRIYIPVSVAQQMISGSQSVSTIDMQVNDQTQLPSAKNDITTTLLAQHHIQNAGAADFSFLDQASISATASSITGLLTLLLGSIAGISLIVGGIGIMNMMLTSITERTREIGLRKAVGAKSADISNQFLFEAVALTVIGGCIGIMLGYLCAYAVTATGAVAAIVSMQSVLMSVGVSALTGIVFGYFPARKAAKLNPIDALRYE
jgi:putative ABC transport system permease protein